ncbi:MAG: ATP-binding protein [Rhodospirillaceae bacterium]
MAVTAQTLLDCDQEPIRIPGSVQPHGFLIALRADGLAVRQASANAGAALRVALPQAIGRPLGEVAAPAIAALIDPPAGAPPTDTPSLLGMVEVDGRRFDAVAHRTDGTLVLEFEEAGGQADTESAYEVLRGFVEDLHGIDSEAAACRRAAAVVRRITGFDRVLVYRFDAEWNGTVVAEDRNDALPSYLDLRFPAADIPAQARALYRLSRIRQIPDSGYGPVPLLGAACDAPLDLSQAVLRSVSPVHLEYMRNMGTVASMSLSIVIEGRLWGLISCHHHAARCTPFRTRVACDFVARTVALRLAAQGMHADAADRVALQDVQARLLARMAAAPNFVDGLTAAPGDLLGLARADGAAVVHDGRCVAVGATPEAADIQRLVSWLDLHVGKTVFATAALAREMPGAGRLAERAAGVLAVAVSGMHASYVLWFRQEVERTVTWGGDPRKSGADARRLSPRTSFEAWKETVRETAAPWTPAEIDAARSLRTAVVDIVLRKAEELAALTDELVRSNRELEAFSYSVSHDLRAPFRHIVGYAELLVERDGGRLDEKARHYIRSIIDSAYAAGKLVDDLLNFSQMGRASLHPVTVDMNKLVDEARRSLAPDIDGRDIEWRIARLPAVRADPSLLRQAVLNLLSNAAKYTRERSPAIIEVTGERIGEEAVIAVRDNGIGFDMAYVDKLFGVFQRLNRVEDYEGTGIGLANVRRIVERHGGRAWAEGEVGHGAVFRIALPRAARKEE